MKNKILIIVLYIILILITIKLIFSSIVNNMLITDYNDFKYEEKLAEILTFLNFDQSYVANYNYGNILYQKQEYERAIEKYSDALKGFIPEYKECNIRINYALAICKTVKLNEENQDEIDNAINKYESAINILTQKGCANIDNDNGHNKDAETLKKDIQKEIERLKNLKDDNEKEKEENSKKEEEKNNSINTQTIEQKMKEIKENAIKKQRETEESQQSYTKEFNIDKKNW